MPELPEVEVVKKSLEHKLKNLTIKRVFVNNSKLRYEINRQDFSKLGGLKVISVKRRSKYLLLNLSKNYTILSHLGMTGKFFIIDRKKKRYKTSFYYSLKKNNSKHDHITIYLNKGYTLIYNDVRKFGFIKLFFSDNILKSRHLALLGPEPLSKNFNQNYFKKKIQNTKKRIKDLLMDQKFVSGLGNIYCNEILYLSKINPSKIVKKIKKKEINRLIKFTKVILKKSILRGGSSIKNFSSVNGKEGNFQQEFNVYNREKGRCYSTKCSGIIKKRYISNRSSFFCPVCQK